MGEHIDQGSDSDQYNKDPRSKTGREQSRGKLERGLKFSLGDFIKDLLSYSSILHCLCCSIFEMFVIFLKQIVRFWPI